MTEYKKAQIISKHKIISEALARHNNCKAKAARELQMDRKTIYNVIKNYNEIAK